LPRTTTFGQISETLASQFGIPQNVQFEFRDFGPWLHQSAGDYVVLDSTNTLMDAWEAQENYKRQPWGEVSQYDTKPEPGEKTKDFVRLGLSQLQD
jgi:hypothetical protein